jgi:hypothetical protein
MPRRDEVYWWPRIGWRSPHVSNYHTGRSTWISLGRSWDDEEKNMQPAVNELYCFSWYFVGDLFTDRVLATVVNRRQRIHNNNNEIEYSKLGGGMCGKQGSRYPVALLRKLSKPTDRHFNGILKLSTCSLYKLEVIINKTEWLYHTVRSNLVNKQMKV